jgi:hypothetical protein
MVSKKTSEKWFWFKTRAIRDLMLLWSSLITMLSLFAIIFGGLSIYKASTPGARFPEPLSGILDSLHAPQQVDLCLLPLGMLIVLFSGWYMGDQIVKRKRFNKLIDTESKSKFLDNQDEIEELAWRLSTKHEHIVMEKKKELKIRR